MNCFIHFELSKTKANNTDFRTVSQLIRLQIGQVTWRVLPISVRESRSETLIVCKQGNNMLLLTDLEVHTRKYLFWHSRRIDRTRNDNNNTNAIWHSYFLIHWQSFYQKQRNRRRKYFSSSENAIWSILLKYQEIDMQIQTFTDEDRNILDSCSFDRY